MEKKFTEIINLTKQQGMWKKTRIKLGDWIGPRRTNTTTFLAREKKNNPNSTYV